MILGPYVAEFLEVLLIGDIFLLKVAKFSLKIKFEHFLANFGKQC